LENNLTIIFKEKIIKAALILSLISILSQNLITPKSNVSAIDMIDSSHLSAHVLIKSFKKRVRRATSLFKIFLQIHVKAIFSRLWQTLFLSCLILCTPFSPYIFTIAPVLFTALFTKTLFNFLGCFCRYKPLRKLIDRYCTYVDFVCKTITVFCLCLIVVQFFQWLLCDVPDYDLFFLIGSVAPSDRGQWIDRYRCGDVVIEENEQYYRVHIGSSHWEFYKGNTFDKKIFSVLLAMAKDEKGHPLLSTRKLARAFGYSTHDLLNRLVLACKAEGDTLTALIGGDRKGYRGKIRGDICKILQEDVRLSLVEIRDRLIEKGWHKVTIAQIKCAMANINFNALHKHIRRQHPLTGVLASSEQPKVKIDRRPEGYRVSLGNLFWDIADDNKFDLSCLLYFFKSVRDQNGQQIVSLRNMGQMLNMCLHGVQTLIDKSRYIAEKHKPLKMCKKILLNEAHDQYLRDLILEIWQEDIFLNGRDVRRRLQARGEQVSHEKLRYLMGNVDFWSLRRRLAKDYQKGKYRKSVQWVLAKQQELIESLIDKLKQGTTYSPAQIIQFVEELPAAILPERRPEKEKQADVHWLKCFLFNLPKQMGGKFCCPKCGHFNTGRKSLIPSVQTITDAKTGVVKTVNTYRFYCKNPDCSTTSFTATPDAYLARRTICSNLSDVTPGLLLAWSLSCGGQLAWHL